MRKNNSILIITERFYPEDFGINDLVVAWHQKGYKVAVLTQTPSYPFGKPYEGYRNRFFQTDSWNGIKVYRVFSLMGYRKSLFLKISNYLFFVLLASFVSLFIAKRYKNIFVYQVGPLTQAIPAIVAKKVSGGRLYIWTLDVWPDSVYAYGFKERRIYKKVLDWFVKVVYKQCAAVFISCKGFRGKIEKYVPDMKVIYAPQWAPKRLDFNLATPHELLKEGFNFTFAGNIGKMQNLENIIRGFALISVGDDQARLNIIGDGSNLDALKEIVRKENIENVYFWGRRPLNEIPSWFKGSDVLIISLIDKPIFSLTVPAKFQAYLASGKPIYCVMKGEVADLVMSNKIGFVAQPNNIDDIKAGFEKFIKTPKEEFDILADNMAILLRKEFDYEQIAQKFTEEIFI